MYELNGVREFLDVEDDVDFLRDLYEECKQHDEDDEWVWPAAIVFNDAGRSAGWNIPAYRGDAAKAFAAFIKKHGLGPVVSSRWKVNPNTGNPIKVWVWNVNAKACDRLLARKEKE